MNKLFNKKPIPKKKKQKNKIVIIPICNSFSKLHENNL